MMLGDVLVPDRSVLPKLLEAHATYGASVLAVTPVEDHLVSRYGIVEGHEVEPGIMQLTDLVEKPTMNDAPSNLAIFGRYLLTPKIMELLPHVKPGRGDEIQLTDALKELLKTEKIYAVTTESGHDTGNVLSWLEVNVALALQTEELGPALRDSLEKLLG